MPDPVDPPAVDPPATDPPKSEPADEPFDKDRAMATILKLREAEKAGKSAARERDDLAAKLKEYEDREKTDAQKQAERLAAYEAQERQWAEERRVMNLRIAVLAKQGELGIIDPELALLALDRSKIEFDKEGQPQNVTEALTALLEAKPILKGKAATPVAPNVNPGAGAQDSGTPPSLTPEELVVAKMAGMSPEDYAKAKGANTITGWQTKGAPATS